MELFFAIFILKRKDNQQRSAPIMTKFTKFLTAAMLSAIFFINNVNAQSTAKFSAGATIGSGTDDRSGLAIGIDLRYQINLTKQLSLPITVGFTSILGTKYTSPYSGKTGNWGALNYWPLKLGVKVFVNENAIGTYVMVEGGIAIMEGRMGGGGPPGVFSPAIGYTWSNGLDIGVKYEAVINKGFAGIRLGYGF